MSFDSTANNLVKIPIVSHAVSSSSLVLNVSGTAFPSTPFRVTAIYGPSYQTSSETLTIFGVSAVQTNTPTSGECTLTVSAIEGTTDRTYGSFDYAEVRLTAGTIGDLNTAMAALQAATYIVQTSTSAPGSAQILASLGTGLLKVTTTTGVLSTAVAGTDYQAAIALTTSGSNGAATFVGNTLNIPEYAGTQFWSPPNAITPTATPAIAYANGNFQTMTLSANVTAITLTGMANGQGILLRFQQAASGSPFTVAGGAWPAGVSWFGPGYAAPSMPTTFGAAMRVVLQQTGTNTWDGMWQGNNNN